ncbi:hypothetical protein LZ32DRAFT_55972 [Colletotrichum eremochloae]|nr:hypothetical protein LZ32DRAFT_55972 [Colletotrichum eremochloae]
MFEYTASEATSAIPSSAQYFGRPDYGPCDRLGLRSAPTDMGHPSSWVEDQRGSTVRVVHFFVGLQVLSFCFVPCGIIQHPRCAKHSAQL